MEFIKKVITHPLFAGSAVMVVGSNITNVINYIYHLVMGRLLGPATYGELATLVSLIGLLGIIPLSFNLVIVKFISSTTSKEEVSGFINWLEKRILFLGIGILIIIVMLSPFLATFLNIGSPILIITAGLVFLFSVLTVSNRAVLQGLLRFNHITVNLTLEFTLRLIFGIILVYFGFSVLGAMFGFVAAVLISWFLSINFISDYTKVKKESVLHPNAKALFLYSGPILLFSFANTSLYSADIILVKHFFSSYDAGLYAAVSTLGKILLFAAGPVAQVMFPLIAKRNSNGEDYKKIFVYSLLFSSAILISILLVYFIIPDLTVRMLFGNSYLEATKYLLQFSFFTALLTLASLLVNFYLSIGKMKIVVLPLIAAFCQIIGIWMFHNNLSMVINVSLVTSAFLIGSLLLYFCISGLKIKQVFMKR